MRSNLAGRNQKSRHSPVQNPPKKQDASNAIGVGAGLRAARERAGLSVRELARRAHVSASLISQIERDRASPSVGTLFAIANELGISVDDLFKGVKQHTQSARVNRVGDVGVVRGPIQSGPVQKGTDRSVIRLQTGVRWERLTPSPDEEVEFLYVVYEVGGASCEENSLFRHDGKEYGYVISGRLGIQIGFEKYELGPGDSIKFDARMPHRLWTMGREPVVCIFAILRRHNDSRTAASRRIET